MPAASFLAVDVGNSSVKAGLWDGASWVRYMRTTSEPRPAEAWAEFLSDLLSGARPDASGIASVAPAVSGALADALAGVAGPPAVVRGTMQIPGTLAPFHTEYGTPETLGADRLAAAAAAFAMHAAPAGRAAIAVDAGTAVTLDAVTAAGAHLGGAILPGPDAIVGSLARRTAQLPEVRFDRPDRATGTSSVLSIQSGVTNLLIDGLAGLLARTAAELAPADAPPLVIATGGWGEWLQAYIDIDVLAPDLVLDGVRLLGGR